MSAIQARKSARSSLKDSRSAAHVFCVRFLAIGALLVGHHELDHEHLLQNQPVHHLQSAVSTRSLAYAVLGKAVKARTSFWMVSLTLMRRE